MVSPPRPKGPPLNALRAFEAAARLGGFAAAANELSVTPGAVTQHIKALESWIGADLFERKSQGVQLSKLGESVVSDFGMAFDHLGEAVDKLRNLAPRTEIRIATLPSIAQLWLSPRMPMLRSAVPGATFSIIATEAPPNLLREPIDLNLFFEAEAIPSYSIEIAEDYLYPVCSPDYAKQIKTLYDLSRADFLHDTSWSKDWDIWLQAQGADEVINTWGDNQAINTRGATYSLYALALEEAVNGSGVLMGHDVLVRPHIQRGQLVALFNQPVPVDHRLMATCAKRPTTGSALAKVIDQLLTA